MKNLLILLTILISLPAFSSIPGLEAGYDRILSGTKSDLQRKKLLANPKVDRCSSQILNMRKDGVINIMASFGYMDITHGQGHTSDPNDLYGDGDVLDMDAAESLKKILKSSCNGNNKSACNFKGRGDRLTKTFNDRWGKRITVNIDVISPSYTSDDQANKTTHKASQTSRTAWAKSLFLNALNDYDMVIYMGHARSGGGPDFAPPVTYNNGKVNYSHYQSRREGIRSMLNALGSSPNPPGVIGVLACYSTGLFAADVRRNAPNSKVVTSGDLFQFYDILPTGYAMIQAVVSQRCGGEFSKVVKIQPDSASTLSIFN